MYKMTGITTTKTYQFERLPLIGLTVSDTGNASVFYQGKDEAIDEWAAEEIERIKNGEPTIMAI